MGHAPSKPKKKRRAPRSRNFNFETVEKTNLDAAVESYMRQDPLDPTATIDFLMAVDGLDSIQPEVKPWRSIEERVMDDICGAYAIPSNILGVPFSREEKMLIQQYNATWGTEAIPYHLLPLPPIPETGRRGVH